MLSVEHNYENLLARISQCGCPMNSAGGLGIQQRSAWLGMIKDNGASSACSEAAQIQGLEIFVKKVARTPVPVHACRSEWKLLQEVGENAVFRSW
jgi:hypothetical protein